jgi:hypothetical protein
VINGATSSSYTTPALTISQVYWAQVSDNVSIADTAPANVNIAFTDDTLTAGVSEVKAIHVTELRTRINALLVRFGRPAWTWTDPSLAPGNPIKAVHITDMRNAILSAYSFGAMVPPTFTDPTLTAGLAVKRVHFQELRDAVNALEAK